jgi:hypothetical protein
MTEEQRAKFDAWHNSKFPEGDMGWPERLDVWEAAIGAAEPAAENAMAEWGRSYDERVRRERREALRTEIPKEFTDAMRRLTWLHASTEPDAEGYEWGIFRVKWSPSGEVASLLHTRADFADMDAAIRNLAAIPQKTPAAPEGSVASQPTFDPWGVVAMLRKPGEPRASYAIRRTVWTDGKPASEYLGRTYEPDDYAVACTEAKRLNGAHSAAPPSCDWQKDADGIWHTGCGAAFTFDCDGPSENNFNFCHHCGKPLASSSSNVPALNPLLSPKLFTDDEVDDFYDRWEFNEEDPGRLEFSSLFREIEYMVRQRALGVASGSQASAEGSNS